MTLSGEPLLEFRSSPFQHWRVTPAQGVGHGELILVHGLGEHAGRMMPLARRFAAMGYRCRVPDLPGHGASGEDSHHAVVKAYLKGRDASEVNALIQQLAPSLITEAKQIAANKHQQLFSTTFEQIIEQVEKLTLWSAIDGTQARVPHHVWGHSLGGLAAFHAVSRIDRDQCCAPTSLVLGSAAFSPPAAVDDLLNKFIIGQAYLLSSFSLLRPIAALQRLFLQLLRIDGDGRFANEHVSDLPAERLLHSTDPLQNHQIPLCFAGRLLPWMARARKVARTLRTPVLIFAPGFDPIVNTTGSRGVAASLPNSIDDRRPHRLDIHESMKVHDLVRSSCAEEIISRVHSWMKGDLGH